MSIISRNVADIGNKFLQNLQYQDISYKGYIDPTTSPTLKGGSVILNNLRIWLLSSKGDYYRRITMGGFFDTVRTTYPLNSANAATMTIALTNEIQKQFPTIEVIGCDITPDYQARGWIVKLIVKDTLLGVVAALSEGIAA